MAPKTPRNRRPAWQDYAPRQDATQARLQNLLSQPVTPADQRRLSGADRSRELTNFGLALMQAGANPNNNLFSALGQAGQATMADVDQRKQAAYQQDADARKAKAGALAQALDYLNHQQNFAADRADAAATRDYHNSRLDMAKHKNESDAAYRKRMLDMKAAQAKQDAKLNAARIDATHALADKRRGVGGGGGSGGSPGRLGDHQVRLKNGDRPYSMTELRQMYRENYGKYDPKTQMYTFSDDTPRFEQWLSSIVTPESNPLHTVAPQQSGLQQLLDATAQMQQQSQRTGNTPYNVPVPMRGGTDYLDGLR